MNAEVIWHDVECGAYAEDVGVWRALAAEADGPVLDVGAGTGRITLDLAGRGVPVVALDISPALLEALAERAAGLPVETVCADARSFELGGRRFPLVIVPMQAVQLLGGPEGRSRFLARARAHLVPGGRLAIAIADPLETYDAETDGPPEPDLLVTSRGRFSSLPLALVDEGDRAAIHRLREFTGADGRTHESHDVVRLDRVTPDELAAEARAAGFAVEPARHIPETDRYIGSTVVVARA
jgi:SAM-dependent methyltransferase